MTDTNSHRIPPLWKRFLGIAKPDPMAFRQGMDAARKGGGTNPYDGNTLQHWSWNAGFKSADDWDYVW